jgi:hypothetical protein
MEVDIVCSARRRFIEYSMTNERKAIKAYRQLYDGANSFTRGPQAIAILVLFSQRH